MTDETYNGWKNYPTWCVNLWLENDQGLYETTVEIVEGQHNPSDETFRYNVMQAIKDWVRDDLAPDLGATFAADHGG
jgi:hypothetical protein